MLNLYPLFESGKFQLLFYCFHYKIKAVNSYELYSTEHRRPIYCFNFHFMPYFVGVVVKLLSLYQEYILGFICNGVISSAEFTRFSSYFTYIHAIALWFLKKVNRV